jgi:glycosyl transferase family 92
MPAADPTGSQAWASFSSYAAWALVNPKFDLEQREYRLEIAQRFRGLLRAVRDGSLLFDPGLESVFLGAFGGRHYKLTVPRQNEWLNSWAKADEELLARAMIAFTGHGDDAVARFERFAALAEEAVSAGKIDADPGATLAFGSLFNFAIEPESLPVIRNRLFTRLQRILGLKPITQESVVDQYRYHLEFATSLHEELSRRAVPVRDMVDTQSLIWVAAEETEIWASGSRATDRGASEPRDTYLAICAIYRDEARYLREWIEFHRLVGVERFFLYDNGSEDDHLQVLEPYLRDGTVVLHDWPLFPAGQQSAYDHCLREHGEQCRWIAFIDLDEFLFSPAHSPLPELLGELEAAPGVGVNAAIYGFSGHRRRPAGLVIENYLKSNPVANTYIKSIVDPARAVRCESAHHFSYRDGFPVDEHGYTIRGFMTNSVSLRRLRINHYWARSEEEFREKYASPQAATGTFRPWAPLHILRRQFHETDRSILHYLEPLRRALDRRSIP